MIPTTEGRPERRYCTAAHRAAARQARRAATQAGPRDPAQLAETLPWLREPADGPVPARLGVEVLAPDAAARESRAHPSQDRGAPRPHGRALAMLGVAGILAGAYAATDARPEPSPSVSTTPEEETADAWAQRASVALTSMNRELDVLDQAEQEWQRMPEHPATVPPPVAALEERRSVLQRRRATLQSQLDAYRSLRRTEQDLAVSEQHLRAVEKALAGAPPQRRRSSEQEAAIAALDEQRDLRIRQRDAQRAELDSLQEGMATATRAPLPDDGAVTTEVSRDVHEMVRNGGTTATQAGDPGPPRPDGRAADAVPDVLAELRERAKEVAREARKAEAARRTGATGTRAGQVGAGVTDGGTPRSPERARRGDAKPDPMRPSPRPRASQADRRPDPMPVMERTGSTGEPDGKAETQAAPARTADRVAPHVVVYVVPHWPIRATSAEQAGDAQASEARSGEKRSGEEESGDE